MAKDLQKKEQSTAVTLDASMFEADAGVGNENLTQEDLALPFIKVEPKDGQIFNSVTNETYNAKDGIRVIPCIYQRRYIEWSPRGTGSNAPENIYTPEEWADKTISPEVVRNQVDNKDYIKNSQNYIEETCQHFVLVLNEEGFGEPAVIAMKSTQLKKSRKWNSMVSTRMATNKDGMPFQMPRFSHVYHLKTVPESNNKGEWYGWEIALEKQVDDPKLYVQARDFAKAVQDGSMVAKHSQDEETDTKTAPGEGVF